MTPNQHNTRPLSNGDTLTADDFIVIPSQEGDEPELLPLESSEIGVILDGWEEYEYRRPIISDPFIQLCEDNGITSLASKAELIELIEKLSSKEDF